MSTRFRSTTARAALVAAVTLATVTGAFAAPRGAGAHHHARDAARHDHAGYGAYAASPAPVFGGGVYAPTGPGLYAPAMPYGASPYASSDSDRLDPAKGHIQGN